ncbi:peroxiredoxin [candidate division KSB1 bacterium]|nr:peroxiredoxin [candidate division KSB1 bacterium]
MSQFLLIILFLGVLGFSSMIAGPPKVGIGKPAPDFTLMDQDGVNHTLSDYMGQWVLVYFYPKDDTPGCTVEACTFRDNYRDFEKVKMKVFGISADDAKSHKKFTEKYHLPFSLLADIDAIVMELYGVKIPDAKKAKRHSFLIDPQGKVKKIYDNVTPADHPDEILYDLKAFQ